MTHVVTQYKSLSRYTPPTIEPVTLAEAKAHCRVDVSDDDTYISSLITAARTYVEDVLDISIINTVWEARYDGFPEWEIILPRVPMSAQTVTVTYVDLSGSQQAITSTGSNFRSDAYATPGRIYPNFNEVWPPSRGDENSVTVRWTAGYGTLASAVPQTLKHMILLLVAHWYESRQPVAQNAYMPIPTTFDTLLASSGWGGYR